MNEGRGTAMRNWRLGMKAISKVALVTLGIVAGFALSMGLVSVAVDAAIIEANNNERANLNYQGRAAWDRYCESVFIEQSRPDDLDTIYAECSAEEWERNMEGI